MKLLKNRSTDFIRITNKEISKIENYLLEDESELNEIRDEINNLSVQNESGKKRNQSIKRLYSFIGELNEVLNHYQIQFKATDEKIKLNVIIKKIESLEKIVSKANLKTREEVIQKKISNLIHKYATLLEGERSDDLVVLDFKELSLAFKSKTGQTNYLWEIGSGHNYLVYHIASVLAIHEYLHAYKKSVIPSILIIDQPSQVYFPEVENDTNISEGDDMQKVKNLFKALSEFNTATKGEIQIIVLEHVGKSVFEGFDNIHLVERWREGSNNIALIPQNWIE